ncbi:TetR/AcrR family transcriptional regulator [Segnochrobactraceae bacterium EtOH-i3]
MTSETVPSTSSCCLMAAIRRPRGRPRQLSEEERRQKLIETAVSVFLDLGYDAASMDEIAHRAGMSKRTLYQVFKSKEDLFVATLLGGCTLALGAPAMAEDLGGNNIEEILIEHLERVAETVLSPERIALSRILMSEGRRSADLANRFDVELFQRGTTPLVAWIQKQIDRGVFRAGDPREAASMLFGMSVSEAHMRLVMGVATEEVAAPGRIRGRIVRAVRLFLGGALVRS